MTDQADLENRFTYHSSTFEQNKKYELVPEGREKALALTKLEELVFWANAGIARNA